MSTTVSASSPSIKAAQARFAQASLHDGLRLTMVFDASGDLTFVSPLSSTLLGVEPHEALGRNYLACIYHADVPGVLRQARLARQAGHPVGVRSRVVHQHTRAVTPLVGTATPLYDDQGSYTGLLVRMLECADTDARSYDDWFSHTSELFAVLSKEGLFQSVNEATRALLGIDELEGLSMLDVLHPDDHPYALELFDTLLKGPTTTTPLQAQLRVRSATGERVLEIFGRNALDVPALRGIVLDARDVTEQVRYKEALKASEAHHRSLVEQLPLGLWSLDVDNMVTYVNPALSAMLGYEANSLIGHCALDFVAAHHRDAVRLALSTRSIEQGQRYFVTLVHAEGHFVETSHVITVVDGTDPTQHMLAVVTDVTAYLTARRHAALAQTELAEAARAKNELLSRISHELRTPLHAITGYAELLEKGLPENAQPLMENMKLAVTHLRSLIDDTLAVTTLTTSPSALRLASIRLADLVEEALTLVAPLAATRRVRFELDVPDHERLVTDQVRLVQAVVNLLNNAVKFSPENSVVSVSCDSSTSQVTLRVSDQGPGVDPRDVERIFDPFVRGANAATISGSGLGLSVVKATATALGGSVSVNANTFSLSLARTPALAPTALLASLRTPLTVIHVEDDQAAADLLREMARPLDQLTLLHAATVRDAVDLARRHQPNLLVLDLALPDGSGDEVLSQLGDQAEVSVVVTTADARSATREKMVRLGVSEFLIKPFSYADFDRAALRALGSPLRISELNR